MGLSEDFSERPIVFYASPLAWVGMNYWLNDFAFRINLQWWVFAFAGAGLNLPGLCQLLVDVFCTSHCPFHVTGVLRGCFRSCDK